MRAAALFLLLSLFWFPYATADQQSNAPTISAKDNSPHAQTATQTPVSQSLTQSKEAEREPRPWWLGDLIDLLGIVAGASLVVWQLGRQQKQALELQKENAREKLRLQVYQEFAPVLIEASDKAIHAGTYVSLLAVDLQAYLAQVEHGLTPLPLRERAIEFSERHHDATNAIVNLIRLIEKYQVVTHDLNIFQLALNVASHDLREGFAPLYESMLAILPMDLLPPNGPQVMNVVCPTRKQGQELNKLVAAYKAAEDNLGGYLFDLNVELQNVFLSTLFNNRVPRRTPIDPKCRVISTEKDAAEALRKYFENETPWGRHKSRIEREVRTTLQAP